jgi:UDP-N-acetylglucosamine/UDP-N-acetylgalactosamine diphosphorylase
LTPTSIEDYEKNMAQTVRSRIEAATKRLRKFNQEHLIRFVAQLEPTAQLTLVEEIERLDLELIESLIKQYVLEEPEFTLPENIQPPQAYPAKPSEDLEQKYQLAQARGEQLIAEHKVAAFTVAGGAGTRLNYRGPKGNVAATPLRNKTLFRVFAEGILAIQRRYNCVVPWYVMTSQSNHDETVRVFENNNYYGLDSDNVMLFSQGMMPSVSFEGKILLGEKGRLALSPDGHGGSLRALHTSGALKDMARRGIEYISYFQVDNPLVNVLDPLFIGLHVQDGAEMSSKAVIKSEPLEKVGNFVVADGRVMVIEYSDLPDALAEQRDNEEELNYNLGSIAIHLLNRRFVERINCQGFSLPWHRAVKSVGCINEQGEAVEPGEPNAVKLETFVFDALQLAEASVILTTSREEEFAPIKNASGVDSLPSSQLMQIERAARWMELAGVQVPRHEDGRADVLIEISPLFAPDAETLIQKRNQLRPLQEGDIVYLG